MILVFGGTTEGRMAVKELEESGSVFWYSTRGGEQQLTLHHGIETSGAKDSGQITEFCKDHQIRLIIDAAHPFAKELHFNISKAADSLDIPVVRFERIYPKRDSRIVWCSGFPDAIDRIRKVRHTSSKGKWVLLSTAGVQSIPKLKSLEEDGIEIFHRILNRDSSKKLAEEYGTDPSHICFYHQGEDEVSEIVRINPDAILLKESGLSGGYREKAEAALKKGVKVFAIERPAMPQSFITVNGPYGMRRMVEKLLPEFYPLHSGLTTGSCAAAAALAAAERLVEGSKPERVALLLPDGETISVDTHIVLSPEPEPHNARSSEPKPHNALSSESEPHNALSSEPEPQSDSVKGAASSHVALPASSSSASSTSASSSAAASSAFSSAALPELSSSTSAAFTSSISASTTSSEAFVIKDSGDDPDVTDKMEIHAKVYLLESPDILIERGAGVGRITLPGFDFPPGEAAINKAPRKMIEDNLRLRFPGRGFRVIISVPGGEEIAHRTFNPRLGIEGGISIIGVSGIIKPFSEEGFINSIRKCMEVAKASGEKRVVINSGAKSEKYLKDYYKNLPSQCFVQYGNKIGDTIGIAYELGFRQITLGIMLGKAVKLAAGNLDTHSSNVTMDRNFIGELLKTSGCSVEIIGKAHSITLARELWDIVPQQHLQSFVNEIVSRCKKVCSPLCSEADLTVLLIDDDGRICLQESR